jgi:hypothetical protein
MGGSTAESAVGSGLMNDEAGLNIEPASALAEASGELLMNRGKVERGAERCAR